MFGNLPVTVEPIALKDAALGFFIALALRRGRISSILDKTFAPISGGKGSE